MIESMRIRVAVVALLAFSKVGSAQNPPAPQAPPKVVTVPATFDHNRIIVDVYVPAMKGITERVRAWIDTGNPELFESGHVAQVNGRGGPCEGLMCSPNAPTGVVVNDMDISFEGVKQADFPIGSADTALIPGVKAEMNLPSSVLRHYDVLIDFPGRKVTIGTPGSIRFNGVSAKVQINPDTGVITVPGKIDNKKYDLELDLGSPMSSLSSGLFDALAAAHPDWPHMTGAVGPVSEWGTDQMKSTVMRLDRLQFGPLFLANVPVVALGRDRMEVPGRLENVAGAGLVGSEALQNYRVGIDYAHSMVYFDIGRMFNFPDFDVVGLVLRPEHDGEFSILGVADFDGKPSVATGPDGVQPGDQLIAVDGISVRGSTMGQVWSLLGGTPGQERKLTIERAGREFVVAADVMHFLGEAPDENVRKPRR
jgi:hypothetical protein